jgi:hypothetical protein
MEYLINSRICPLPMHWNELYEILVRETGDPNVLKPLILAGWNFTSDGEKRQRFRYHLKLINKNDINPAREFMNGLKEEKWYHDGE